MINLTAAEVLASLDLSAVENVILIDPDTQKTVLLAHEYEDARVMVWAAAEKWLVNDLNHLSASSLGLEERFDLNIKGYPVRGFLDIRGQYYRGHEEKGTPLAGRVLIADWKTSSGELDKTWEQRLIDSHQWPLYASVPPTADFISYRGMNTKGKTREVFINAYQVPNLAHKVEEYFGGVGDMMTSLLPYDTWPQNMPGACGMFNSTCPTLEGPTGCRGVPPKYLITPEELTLSYSGAQRFLACPEKWRRTKRAESGLDSTDATRLGVCTHRGLEELWRQAFAKYGS